MGKTVSSVQVNTDNVECLGARAGDRYIGRDRVSSSELILRSWVWNPK